MRPPTEICLPKPSTPAPTSAPSAAGWAPLALLRERFAANCRALASRRPGLAALLDQLTPAAAYMIRPTDDAIHLGVATDAGVEAFPQRLSPAAARDLVGRICPDHHCHGPLFIAGEDLGWLWSALYQLPCKTPTAPGHRPPLYFLVGSLERLWLMMHLQDWSAMLADARVALLVGPDSIDQLKRLLIDDAARPWPKQCATIDPSLWPAGMTIDALIKEVAAAAGERFNVLRRELDAQHAWQTAPVLASQYSTDVRPLRVLGITSRYTTFLQHSMRDWLAAFERLGHVTHLVIEQADHEINGGLAMATACAEFTPDLIVCIDHFRKELPGLPANVPVVMWVQDALPAIFCPAAGAAQGDRDYCLGFARLKLSREFGYPASRYMPAIVGVDETRFAPRELSASDRERFGGEVAFVSHASATAEQIIEEELRNLNGSPVARRLFGAVYEQLRAVYTAGDTVTEPIAIRRMIDRAMADTGCSVPPDQVPTLVDLFSLRVNNALFRHQTLLWLADQGVDLRLWGRGWERHPKLARFARGPADNANQLPLIYQAAAINLQVTPHGAVHQRTMEGLAAGGFFLLRECPGDLLEREFRAIWDWARANGITSDDSLQRRADEGICDRLARVARTLQYDPFGGDAGRTRVSEAFIDVLRASHDDGYIRSAGTVWENDYDSIRFNSADELKQRVSHYLANIEERRAIASSMRRVVLGHFTYTATSRRLIRFIANDLSKQPTAKAAA